MVARLNRESLLNHCVVVGPENTGNGRLPPMLEVEGCNGANSSASDEENP